MSPPCEVFDGARIRERRDSYGSCFNTQISDSCHTHSAGLEDKFSPLQVQRQFWNPTLPVGLLCPVKAVEDTEVVPPCMKDEDKTALEQLFPNIWKSSFVKLVPCGETKHHENDEKSQENDEKNHENDEKNHENDEKINLKKPLRIGVVLSGGQAPGGHNVISGVYDYIKKINPTSQLFGFIGGPRGIFTHNYVQIENTLMNQFRNQGGFDMIRSGRHKIETDHQKAKTMEICQKLDLHGLIVIGGDDSNTNAAIVAEYFEVHKCPTKVIGCPKTIDGDLRNEYIEASFGFDTAVKTYSEFIGNLCNDIYTSGKYYHFVRLMGRSASHITLECAMQTRPNIAIIGEEVQAENKSLKEIVDDLTDMIVKRSQQGLNYGIILLPEGLIEFVPEMGKLITEINAAMAGTATNESQVRNALTAPSEAVFAVLPPAIRNQLLLDRDPHGNVQVAMIATEKLLILMVENELKARQFDLSHFNPQSHYFGYEGRCGMPSVFDSNYCYALGYVGAALIDNGCTGCMASLKGLKNDVKSWEPRGCPLTRMMNMELRKGKSVPVIRKFLVELDGPLFQVFSKAREAWRFTDLYRIPGPIQFHGPQACIANYTINVPTIEELVPDIKQGKQTTMSDLQKERLSMHVPLNPIFSQLNSSLVKSTTIQHNDQDRTQAVSRCFPLQAHNSKNVIYDAAINNDNLNTKIGLTIGVVLTGQQAPGVANVLCGLFERTQITKGRLIGFKGADGLLNNDYKILTKGDLEYSVNQGGFDVLGRTAETEGFLATPQGIQKIKSSCLKHDLDGLVMIGGCWALSDCATLTEVFLKDSMKTRIVGVPATQNNNIDSRFIETTIGFDSASKCYSQLIGNLLTDAASATKYWYFIRIMGRSKSQMVLEAALQTHSNVTLVSEVLADGNKTINDVVLEICDTICSRANSNKNFGAVLIPEGLMTELPQMRQLLSELTNLMSTENVSEEDQTMMVNELAYLDGSTCRFRSKLTKWSWELLTSLPEFIRLQLVQPRTVGRFQIARIASEQLISEMVAIELKKRSEANLYTGSFSPVCFYFGYQARSSMPSQFDSALGLAHGYLSAMCVESNLTGYVTSVRGLCGKPQSWCPRAFPISAMLRMPPPDEMYATNVPMVIPEMINLKNKALIKVESATDMWQNEDRFCNPGPMQFWGEASKYYTRFLFEQQHEYLRMIKEVSDDLEELKKKCAFGVDVTTLQTTAISLDMLNRLLVAVEQGSGPTYTGISNITHKDENAEGLNAIRATRGSFGEYDHKRQSSGEHSPAIHVTNLVRKI